MALLVLPPAETAQIALISPDPKMIRPMALD
jgi:hypothetical protein